MEKEDIIENLDREYDAMNSKCESQATCADNKQWTRSAAWEEFEMLNEKEGIRKARLKRFRRMTEDIFEEKLQKTEMSQDLEAGGIDETQSDEIVFVCLSDTHSYHNKMDRYHTIPSGDVLLCAGDMTQFGDLKEVRNFIAWFAGIPGFKYRVAIAGNHDYCLEEKIPDPDEQGFLKDFKDNNIIYLQGTSTIIEGYKIYGSPCVPRHFSSAFALSRGNAIKLEWSKIPEDVDILITHTPPYGILDKTNTGKRVGCEDLKNRVEIIKPLFHIFGHIHEAYGEKKLNGTTFINCCIADCHYRPRNQCKVFRLPKK